MAVTETLLVAGGTNVATTSANTTSVTPSANKLLAVYLVTDNGSPTSVTGNGLTWVQEILNTALVPIACYRSMGASPSAGAITINLGANSVLSWIVVEYGGVDTSGTNGSGAVRSSQDTSGTGSAVQSLQLTLPGAVNAGNAVAAMFIAGGSAAMTPGAGYTKDGETTASGFVNQAHIWRPDGTTTPSVSWTGAQNAAGLAIEIVAAAGGAAPDWLTGAVAIN